MSTSNEQGWGTWQDAERWRREAFKERSAVARLAWLEDVWRLRVASRGCPKWAVIEMKSIRKFYFDDALIRYTIHVCEMRAVDYGAQINGCGSQFRYGDA